jgi:succinate dehydrogenase / fumarate reductase, membrane anchor subunit
MATVATPLSGARVRRVRGQGRSFVTLMWMFMRISGAALIPLALGHLAIMHLINNVHVMNACFVALRWQFLAWRIYDALLLGFALIHGLNGLRYSVDDYIHNPTWNRILRWAIVIIGADLILAGTIALIGGVNTAALGVSGTVQSIQDCPQQ